MISTNCLKKALGLLTLVSVPFLSGGAVAANHKSAVMKIDTAVEVRSRSNILFTITLRNLTSKDFSIRRGLLPWDGRGTILILVPAVPGSTPLKQERIISDPLHGIVKLAAGHSLEGQVDLLTWFPTLKDALEHADVIVFWSYQLETFDGTQHGRVGGWDILHRFVPQREIRRS